jgi:hypothetical protein
VCVRIPKDIFHRSKQQVSYIWEIFVSFTVTLTIISNITFSIKLTSAIQQMAHLTSMVVLLVTVDG